MTLLCFLVAMMQSGFASQGFRPDEEKGQQQQPGSMSNAEINEDDKEGKDEGGEDDMDVNEDNEEDEGENEAEVAEKAPSVPDQDDEESPYCVDLWVIAKSIDHHSKVMAEIFRASGQCSFAAISTRTAHPSILVAAQQMCGEAMVRLASAVLVFA